MLSRVFERIDALQEEYFHLLEEVCEISSETWDFDGVRAVCDALCGFARARGFSVRVKEFDGAGKCAVISMNDDSDGPALMFSGHMDTVYPKGTFPTPACRREGDRLYGPGTSDCKGGIVTALLAMDALKQCGFSARPLKLFLQCDEEVTSVCSGQKSIEWMIEEAKKCCAFLNCESGHPGGITLARKGILKIVIGVHGRAAHAKDYFDGASAVVEAARKILRIHALGQPGGVTCNCTIASQPTASNVVPDLCRIAVDVRVTTMDEARELSEKIRAIAAGCETPGTSGSIESELVRPPMEPCDRNRALFDKVNLICQKNGLPAYEPLFSSGGSDAANVSAAGVPTVDSLGMDGAAYHTLHEYADLPSMAQRAKVLAAVSAEL